MRHAILPRPRILLAVYIGKIGGAPCLSARAFSIDRRIGELNNINRARGEDAE
jgi:hypothetical protein